MEAMELKLCDIQGRLFELFADSRYDAESLVKTFMTSNLAKDLDSEYNRMQWAGEEYLFEELIAVCKEKLILKTEDISKEALFGWDISIGIGIFIRGKRARKFTDRRHLVQ